MLDLFDEPLRLDLRPDCARCFGLCCVAPAFAASADFAIDKASGVPCPNLEPDFRCAIHERLRAEGFPGCVAYDCFGAGQKVAQVTFGGRDWRTHPDLATPMFDALGRMRQVLEILWHAAEALAMPLPGELRAELRAAAVELDRLTALGPDELGGLDVAARHRAVNPLLVRASELMRGAAGPLGPDHRGADLAGADLRAAGLHAANLRGTRLIGADLRAADLRLADVTGADMRGAHLGQADLRGGLFVTQGQLESARGDATTQLPSGRVRPEHWSTQSDAHRSGRGPASPASDRPRDG